MELNCTLQHCLLLQIIHQRLEFGSQSIFPHFVYAYIFMSKDFLEILDELHSSGQPAIYVTISNFSSNHPVIQPASLSVIKRGTLRVIQPPSQLVIQPASQSFSHPSLESFSKLVCQSFSHPSSESFSKPAYQSFSLLVIQPASLPVFQAGSR